MAELIQTLDKLAEHEHTKTKSKEYVQVEAAQLQKLSARLDALEDSQWKLFNKVRNFVKSQPIAQQIASNPIVAKIAENEAVQNALANAESKVNEFGDAAEDRVNEALG